MSGLIIFGLLLTLMLTGMPISIALGLTVLTFLFTLTQVPIESVALKLFTGIENFSIMAIPFFILAGNFLSHGGVAKRMIAFTTSLVGHWPGGLGLAGVAACALFAAVSGSSVAPVVAIGSIILPAPLRCRHHHDVGRPRHPGAALDHPRPLRGVDEQLDRQPVPGGRRPGHRPLRAARRGDPRDRVAPRLSAHAPRHLGAALPRLPGEP